LGQLAQGRQDHPTLPVRPAPPSQRTPPPALRPGACSP
jgi:hypothetical protein